VFFIGAILLAWVIPSSWTNTGILPTPRSITPDSPWSSRVSLDDVAWGNGSPYVRISVGATDAPLGATGWSLENELGERVELGVGVEIFTPGQTPLPIPLSVASHTTLIINTGPSPLGVSFREHVCSGYLRGTIPLTPPTETRCPEPSKHARWSTLDESCKLLVDSLPRCTVLSPEHLGDMSSACESFLRTVPTYTTCVREAGQNALLPRWRIFVEGPSSFIHETGGTILLRDDQGMVVDVLSYGTIGLE